MSLLWRPYCGQPTASLFPFLVARHDTMFSLVTPLGYVNKNVCLREIGPRGRVGRVLLPTNDSSSRFLWLAALTLRRLIWRLFARPNAFSGAAKCYEKSS